MEVELVGDVFVIILGGRVVVVGDGVFINREFFDLFGEKDGLDGVIGGVGGSLYFCSCSR